MYLYLVQHGHAREKEEDASRPLSPQGRDEVARVAQRLRHIGITVPVLWHSGKLRAEQTAQILAQYLAGEPQAHDHLDPKSSPELILADLKDARSDIALVGHLPHLSMLAATLLHTKGDHEPVAFERGAVLALRQTENGKWQVRWYLTPGALV